MKRRILMCWLVVLLSVTVVREVRAEHQFRISTDFPGGTVEVLRVDSSTATLHVQPAVQWGLGFPCWWYLRLDGMNPGEDFTFKISANPRPFHGNTVLNRAWCQPRRVAISTDDVHWEQTDNVYQLLDDGTAVYQINAPAETIWLAWGPPYLPSHVEALLEGVVEKCSSATRFTLAQTRGNRPVPAIRIGGDDADHPAPFGVWIQARQHAWETGSSWVAQGLLQWIASDDPAALELRSMATIWMVPIMDVDRVAIGAGGKDSIPRDHNRDWDETPVYREIEATQSRLAELDGDNRLDVFLDIHNPGDDKLLHYFYGPNQWEAMPAAAQRNHLRWLEAARREIVEPLSLEPEYKFINYTRSREESNRICINWVRNHCAAHVVATTFEAASNTPQSTQTGYQTVGRQLGRALTQYLRENPRRD